MTSKGAAGVEGGLAIEARGQVAPTSGAEIKVVIEVGCRGTGREQK